MRFSYISVLIFLFLLCSVYAINEDAFQFPPDNLGSGNLNPVSNPSNTQGSLIPDMPADFTNILTAGFIGVTIGILLAALAYMVGNFFSFPQMIGWSKNQLWESLYSMILVSSVLIFSIIVHLFPIGVPDALQSNSQISFPEKAALSIDNVVHGEIDLAELPDTVKDELLQNKYVATNHLGVTNLFFTVYSYQLFLDSVYNIVSINFLTLGNFGGKDATGTTATTGSVNFEGQLLSGLKKLMSLSSTVTNYLMTLIMILYVQMSALIFIAGGSVFLFMFGVFFRCLPVTRKMGSTLIALFITLYFVYPAFVIFVYSDGMYGKMSEEFSGAYTESHWFEDMTGFDPNGLTFNTPFGLTQVNSTNFGKGKLFFVSIRICFQNIIIQ